MSIMLAANTDKLELVTSATAGVALARRIGSELTRLIPQSSEE